MTSNLAKRIGVVVVVGVTSSLFWILAKPWVESPNRFTDFHIWLWPLVTLVVLASVIVVALTLFRRRLWELLIVVEVALPFVIIFGTNLLYVTAFGIIFVLFAYADKNIREELDQRIKLNVGLIMERGLRGVMTGILIVVSFAYFLSPGVQSSDESNRLPPTVQEVVRVTVNTFLGGQLDQLPPQQREQTRNQVIRETMNSLTRLAQPYFKYFPPILAFGLFLILQGLSFIFNWFSVWLGQLIFLVLRKSGFVKVEEREVKAERLVEL